MLRNVALIVDLRSSRQRLVAAQDEERRKIERNLHDGAQQQLVALAVQLKLARSFIDRDPHRAERMLDGLQGSATSALEDLRDLARGHLSAAAGGQGPGSGAGSAGAQGGRARDGGLGRARQLSARGRVHALLLRARGVEQRGEVRGGLLRPVHLAQTDGPVSFSVSDDGRGFDPAATAYGTGLQGMADRLAALGGTLEVRSAPPAAPTVAGTLPVGPAPP